MNIIFFGSAKFGYSVLKALIEADYKIPLVVTQPDKQKGRGLKLGSTQIKDLAQQSGLKVFQPEDINSSDSLKLLKSFKPDLFVIIAYGQKFSREFLDIPKIMPVNVHASLLPKYRGAAPINWVIINGEEKTGNTIMKVVPRMDAGPIILQSRVSIEDSDDSVSLEEKLSLDAQVLLLDAVKAIEFDSFSLVEQEESQMSLAPKLSGKIAQINWNEPAAKIHNLVRGCVSWSTAFTKYKDKILKIYKTQIETEVNPVRELRFSNRVNQGSEAVPGEILAVSEKGIILATKKGAIILKELQLEGKKRLDVREFLSGNKILPGERLGK